MAGDPGCRKQMHTVLYYASARFVVIKRQLIDTVRSTVEDARNQNPYMRVCLSTYFFVCHEKKLKRVCKATQAAVVTNEA